jgi:hypothetical protein
MFARTSARDFHIRTIIRTGRIYYSVRTEHHSSSHTAASTGSGAPLWRPSHHVGGTSTRDLPREKVKS